MSISIRHRIIGTAAVVALLLCSCAENIDSPVPEPPQGEGLPVIIRARVSDVLLSRAYQPGPVKYGTYYMTYESRNSSSGNRSYALANVSFNGSEMGQATKTEPGGNRLEWKDIVNGTSIFRLDNVPSLLDAASDAAKSDTLVVFGTENNPFTAGVFDDDNGTNDLLWGSKEVGYNTAQIHFDLHHCMSRVRVVVTADKTNSVEGALDLDDAKVEITSLALTPISYNRLDGTLDLGNAPDYGSLVLTGKEGRDWAKPEEEMPEDASLEVRTTQDFVLPPQGLRDGEDRPRLVITLKNDAVYSGILPHAMEVETGSTLEDGTLVTYPVALSFLREHILTLRTVITEDPPELSFMPVTVVEWVDKGDFALEGHQAGVYNSKDFMDLVNYYVENNEEQLERFGLLNGSLWEFNFWGPATVTDDVFGSMKVEGVKKNFKFKFHGYTCTIGETVYSQDNHDQFVKFLKGEK